MPDEPSYLERRVQSQREWHSDKATWNKRRYYTAEIATMLAGAAIPVINLMAANTQFVGLLSAILGGVVVVAAGIGKLFKFQENWLHYRGVAEALAREEEHYKIGAGEYANVADRARGKLLVERIEGLLASTTSQFIATHRAAATPGAADQQQQPTP